MKVVIGAGDKEYKGWIQTQENELNLLDLASFESLFPKKDVDVFLAEHVWEHLTFEEGIIAAGNCYKYLKPGGYLRVAVPDKNFQNEWYQNMVQIGGPGPKDHPAADHKILYDFVTFEKVFKKAGFSTNLLEYCDKSGSFNYRYWNPEDGMIGRSFRYDTRNSKDSLGMVSIVLDANKTLVL